MNHVNKLDTGTGAKIPIAKSAAPINAPSGPSQRPPQSAPQSAIHFTSSLVKVGKPSSTLDKSTPPIRSIAPMKPTASTTPIDPKIMKATASTNPTASMRPNASSQPKAPVEPAAPIRLNAPTKPAATTSPSSPIQPTVLIKPTTANQEPATVVQVPTASTLQESSAFQPISRRSLRTPPPTGPSAHRAPDSTKIIEFHPQSLPPMHLYTQLAQMWARDPFLAKGTVVMQNTFPAIFNKTFVGQLYSCFCTDTKQVIAAIGAELKCNIHYHRLSTGDLLLWTEPQIPGDNASLSRGHMFITGCE